MNDAGLQLFLMQQSQITVGELRDIIEDVRSRGFHYHHYDIDMSRDRELKHDVWVKDVTEREHEHLASCWLRRPAYPPPSRIGLRRCRWRVVRYEERHTFVIGPLRLLQRLNASGNSDPNSYLGITSSSEMHGPWNYGWEVVLTQLS